MYSAYIYMHELLRSRGSDKIRTRPRADANDGIFVRWRIILRVGWIFDLAGKRAVNVLKSEMREQYLSLYVK